ncbi:uridine phosphorylase [Blochmannia endosymbiont of Camponotus sp. C-003]|uniref:uridine phosphorylase n=1 Tax=unclassified Candidatus Blochmanniella TaxID=711328 RepID=UPI002024B41F|nr:MULTISPECIES: uridine phosphorylase [unclassified Candidatus Blochmannia]URJ23231.1 uridine phosphorylase [Blochmannia endosymbiont of Camponotus sp. C-003]URJ28700.1 uridine phosphorylase [Blochmannia endosymbiont of Camponotus sp. C-046]
MTIINTFHLGLKIRDLQGATLAILPGDPNRVKKIASLMDESKYISSHREFTTWSSKINGDTIIVCSTGIGGPSTSIAVEELSQLGIRTFLRVGTAGAIQKHIKIGDILITTAAVRCDGASQHFAPLEFPAVADLSCTMALIKAAKNIGIKSHFGVTVSSDTFYPGQEREDTYSGRVIQKLRGSMEEWKNLGVISYEMESATLLTMCLAQGLRAGVVTGVIVNRTQKETPNIDLIHHTEYMAIKVVIEGAHILMNKNNTLHNYLK